MSAALGLFRLQQVDSRISQIEARLGKIREILENDSEIRTAIEQVKTAETNTRNLEHTRLTSEEEARDKKVKIQQAESSLYGGSIQNPKELLDLQADITSLKKHLASIEDQELDAMLKVESAQSELQTVKEKLTQLKANRTNANKNMISEQESLTNDLADLKAERKATVSPVDSQVLETYETLRQQKRGLAVAEVIENTCGACGTTLNAALQQNIRHASELVNCPSCGRILYAG